MSQKYEIIPYRQKNSTIIFEAQPILLLNLPVGENVRVSVLSSSEGNWLKNSFCS